MNRTLKAARRAAVLAIAVGFIGNASIHVPAASAASDVPGILSGLTASDIPSTDPSDLATTEPSGPVQLGQCRIEATGAYFWRDWMPIVVDPGTDHGSGLRGKVDVTLQNAGPAITALRFAAVVIDASGRHFPVEFRVADEGDGKNWDGTLAAGASVKLVLATLKGPYLPVGSIVHVKLSWTDGQGHKAAVISPAAEVIRTD